MDKKYLKPFNAYVKVLNNDRGDILLAQYVSKLDWFYGPFKGLAIRGLGLEYDEIIPLEEKIVNIFDLINENEKLKDTISKIEKYLLDVKQFTYLEDIQKFKNE